MKNRIILFLGIFLSLQAAANNMLIQNVSTTGNNAAAKTIQVQFDMSWDNSWRDALNWDAAWIFIKFKDANGLWQHAQLNPTGFANGSGTANTMKVTSDKVGCWAYRSALGSGTFNATSMQLQWNYGLNGLNDVTGLEVRVFSTEMVYVPEGEFNCAKWFRWIGDVTFVAPGNNFPVINRELSPSLTYVTAYSPSVSLRIRGDIGIDTDSNGIIDNITYPTGYLPFFCYKYELTEQQYSDFFNTLNTTQIATLGGLNETNISLSGGQYFSSTPSKAFGDYSGGGISHEIRFLAFADWSGLRPMTFLEFNKASYGPIMPVLRGAYYPAWSDVVGPSGLNNGSISLRDVGYLANNGSSRRASGASYYGIMDFTGNASEPVVKLNYLSFSNNNGNGTLSIQGTPDVPNWFFQQSNVMLDFLESIGNGSYWAGCRYVRSAE